MDALMDGGEATSLASRIRAGELGVNTFIGTIITVWQPSDGVIRRIVNCGNDDIFFESAIAEVNNGPRIRCRVQSKTVCRQERVNRARPPKWSKVERRGRGGTVRRRAADRSAEYAW